MESRENCSKDELKVIKFKLNNGCVVDQNPLLTICNTSVLLQNPCQTSVSLAAISVLLKLLMGA